ncbi:MAG TPA: biotin synthase BioB [Chthoniobacterales bacterium]|nr:biotin synthase BioB [Chthoniobacterales bacterium]
MKFEELRAFYQQPLFDLISRSREIHLRHWRGEEVQRCSLLSIKTGGCSEDCAYCAQSAHYSTGVEREELLSLNEVVDVAGRAGAQGATRFCMGAAWRGVRDGTEKFERVLEIVRQVSALGMEVCVTLGEIGPIEARKLKAAGVTAYNHNIDTSPEFYPEIVTTHTFQDRLNTIAAVQASGMSVCCGGIIGMGESEDDRLRLIEILSELDPQPQSVPINCLMPQRGTPLENNKPVEIFELVRLIAVARIALPKSRVRLAAGRTRISREGQALCFFAGANSIFFGNKLLTAKNPEVDVDLALLRELGLKVESANHQIRQDLPDSIDVREVPAKSC